MLRSSKQLIFFISVCLMVTAATSNGIEQQEVGIDFANVFVPKGFDSNDNVEIVVAGDLPNTCYLRPHGDVKIVNNRIVVDMKATQITDPNVVCINAIVPYMVAVPFGPLSPMLYDIVVNAGSASEKAKTILVTRPNSNSINNFTYANVTSIESLPTNREILITGFHPSSCMEIERVELFANENNDTFSVLPIVKQVQPICDRMVKPFTYTLQLPAPQQNQELLHVRKIDGTALNYIVKATPLAPKPGKPATGDK